MALSSELFNYAELAMVAYADLVSGPTSGQISDLTNESAGMSQKQAEEFAARYPEVVTQFNDTDTSFSVTVFKDSSGNLTVAFKGTLEVGDFLTDFNIALEGAGYDQIVAMYNWWLRVSSPIGNIVPQYQYLSSVNLFTDVPSVSATGELVDDLAADSDQKVDVTGHSLGAHLALAFNTLFSTETNKVTGFNTPGFIDSQVNQDFFSELGGEVPTSANSLNVTNVFADEASVGEQPWNAVAGLHFDDNPTGEIINISIEDQTSSDEPDKASPAFNHSQQILTDSLTVYNLLTQLDPTLTTSEYKTILSESVVGTSGSYESIVDALEVLFGISNLPLPTGNNNRDELYTAINEIQENPDYQSYSGQMQIIPLTESDSAVEFKVKAEGIVEPENALAYRYALVNLNPFVITGNDAIYISHNNNDELELENFSEDYLTDASEFLALKNELSLEDISFKGGKSFSTLVYRKNDDNGVQELELKLLNLGPGGPRNRFFTFGGQGADNIAGSGRSDHLYGNGGDDELIGGKGTDILEGNDGVDILIGGKEDKTDDDAKDILRGGKGIDSYFVGNGDEIEDDKDGEGTIKFKNAEGTEIEVSNRTYKLTQENVYESQETNQANRIKIQLNTTTNTLTVLGETSFTILNFESGDFNIILDGDPVEVVYAELVEGTGGDDSPTGTGEPGDLTATAFNDEIQTFGGNDTADGLAGQDLIVGGDGDDHLSGGADDDIVQGDAGIDALFGNAGNDSLSGGSENDILLGGDGDDVLSGGDGIDVLLGGEGRDVLLGGAGNDFLSGNGDATLLPGWEVVLNDGVFEFNNISLIAGSTLGGFYAPIGTDTGDSLFGGGGDDLLLGSNVSDFLDGGEGNDVIEAGDGNDVIIGGAGNDIIVGDGGNDIIEGGAGNDVIFGDDAPDSASEFTTGLAGDDYIDAGAGNDTVFAGAGDDTVLGGAGDDQLQGQEGNDNLSGGEGDDLIFGDAGNDQISGDDGIDELQGGDGDDVISGGAGDDLLVGQAGNDSLSGGKDNDQLQGGAGDDTLNGDAGNDELQGGVGVDTLNGGTGDDTLFGQAGNDTLFGDDGDDVLQGGAGDDVLDGGEGNDILAGDAGNDTLNGGSGDDNLQGNEGDDTLNGGEGNDTLFGQAGIDTLSGGSGDDVLLGGSDNDSLSGDAGDDQLFGESGDDVLSGDAGNDFLFGGAGNDQLDGGAGNDQLVGDEDDDILSGGEGDDSLFGGDGIDSLMGGAGVDTLEGGNAGDTLDGGDGSDQLLGQSGDDTLEGGLGHDIFIYRTGDGHDVISDAGAYDTILLQNGITQATTSISSIGDDIVITFDPSNSITIKNGAVATTIDAIVFSDGITLTADNFLSGADSGQYFNAESATGVNIKTGTAGDDIFALNGTVDILDGGAGDDVYFFNRGTSSKRITDASGNDTIVFGDGISVGDIDPQLQNGKLTIVVGDDQIEIDDWDNNRIERFVFTDGTELTASDFGLLINHAPEVIMAISDQVTDEDTFFNFTLPESTFSDPDAGDTLSFSATLVDGNSLPGWLNFDPETQTFTGTPKNDDVGSLDIEVTATDSGGLAMTDNFELNVNNINDAPEVAFALPDRNATENFQFEYKIQDGSIVDVDAGDSLTYTATLSDDSVLPSWLSFDAATQTFSGTPATADIGTVSVKVTATDQSGENVTDVFDLKVDSASDKTIVSKIQNSAGRAIHLERATNFDPFESVAVHLLKGNQAFDEGITVDFSTGGSTNYTSHNSDGSYTLSMMGQNVSLIGDINGDGFDDFSIDVTSSIGDGVAIPSEAYIVYGKSGGLGDTFDIANINGNNGTVLLGPVEVSFFAGVSPLDIEAAGDINGDGFADIIVNKTNRGGGPGLPGGGEEEEEEGGGGTSNNNQYVLFGRAGGFGVAEVLELRNGNNGFKLTEEFSSVGDINADGFDDFTLGDRLVFGQASGYTSTLDSNNLTNFNSVLLGDSSNGGIASIKFAGDINQDGQKDFFVQNTNDQNYLVFGATDLDFNQLPSVGELDGNNGVHLQLGNSVTFNSAEALGDINGDGIDDIGVSTTIDLAAQGEDVGPGTVIDFFHIIYGKTAGFNGNIILNDNISGGNENLVFEGSNYDRSSNLPPILSAAGDVDGDGQNDLLIQTGGITYVLLDQDNSFEMISLNNLTPDLGFRIQTPVEAASVTAGGDINGDGFTDIVLGAPTSGSGESYVVYGRDFRQKADFVGSDGDDLINIDNNDVVIYGLAGNDQINISSDSGVFVNAGAGNDTFNIRSSSVSQSKPYTLRGGTGLDSYNITVSNSSLSGVFGVSISDRFGGNRFTYGSAGGAVSPTLALGSLKLTFDDSNVEVYLENFDPNDVLGGPRDIDFFEFNGVTFTYEQLIGLGFDIDGTENNDLLTGTNAVDRINGLAGDDDIQSGDGNDTLTGGLGNDSLSGGTGDDTYIFNIGDGQDTINDIDGLDSINFGSGITTDSILVEQINNDLALTLSADDQIIIKDWFTASNQQLEQFTFADGTTLSNVDIEARIGIGTNNPPVVDAGIVDQTTDEDAVFTFTLSADAFIDPDAGDTLTYSAALVGGAVLPSWLSFDAVTQTFSGTPDNNDVESFDVEVIVSDNEGETASDIFSITVNNVNDVPVLANAIADQSTDEDQPFSFTVSANTFFDDDSVHGDTFTYGVSSTLPDWLNFDADTQTFSGTPDNNDIGSPNVEVAVYDAEGETISDIFSITVNNVNDAPVVSNVIADQGTDEDQPFSFTVPANIFADDDSIHGDTLTYSASLADDSAFPSWLTFDAATQTFSGTSDNDDVGTVDVKVTATDTGGLSISDTFSVIINNVNDAPVVSNAIDDQATQEGEMFTYQLPTDTFHDDDAIHGDTLKYNVTLADGSVLPDWLSFDSATQILSGLVPFNASGELAVQVIATDIEGLSTSDTFTLDITNVINGNKRPNHLIGTVDKDIINGFGKSDWLFGRGGDDVLNGQEGNDHLYGGMGNDILDGGNGKDKLYGGYGDDQLFGGTGNDKLEDWFGNNILDGGEGNDKLFSGAGNDQLEGGGGSDRLFSDGGNDILHGGPGFDRVEGGRGDDTYLFNFGDDIDVIKEQQGNDILRFGEGIGEDDLWFWRDHKDLNIGIIGTEDQVTIEDWYRKNHHGWSWHNNKDNRIEQIELSDGAVLLEGQVQQLVDAMAVFNVSNSGTLDIPQAIQDDVQSVITIAWQAA